jgi:hypothetical protein
VEAEIDLDDHLHGDGMALVHCRAETILADGCDGFFFETHAEVAGYVDVLRVTIRVDDELDGNGARIILLASLLCELGIDGV